MPQIKLSLIRGDKHDKLDYRDNIPVNMTAIEREVEGSKGYLLSHDGLVDFAETGGKARGGTYNARFNTQYRVSGSTFEEVSATGDITPLGSVAGSGACSFASSFNTQAIVAGGSLYYYDSDTFRLVGDVNVGYPIDITWFQGIYVLTDGEFIYHSDALNELSYSPLKFSSSEFANDRILAVARNDQNQILAFNRYSTEYFYFNPSAPTGTSVLQNIPGKSSVIGIVGTHCKTLLDGMFFILGGRKTENVSVHILNAGQEMTVATREIDKIIGGYTEDELSIVVLETRVIDRDKFLIIHLPNETLLYNHTVGSKMGVSLAWTIVKSGVQTSEPWRAKFGVFDPRNSQWVYGDIKENKLGILDKEIASQYGEQVESIVYTPIMALGTKSIDQFEINTIPGFTPTEFTSAFSMSYNGGVTYGMEMYNKISAMGRYEKRYIARRLGYVRNDFNMKFRFVSAQKMAFSGLTVDYS